jgi:hypothetical protein
MINKKRNYELCEKWKLFFNILLDPWLLILLISTIILVVFSNDSDNREFLLYINLLITLTSSLLGGFFSNKWASLTEKNVLEVRAKSAIRSLKLIFTTINNLENRTNLFLNRIKQEDENSGLIKTNLEEIIEKCNILEEETINSIEDWTDIIPEVENVKSQIGLISELKIEVVSKQAEIALLKEESGQNKELQEKLENKEKELQSIKAKLATAETKISNGLLSGITVNSGLMGLTGLAGAYYKPSGSGLAYITGTYPTKTCTICRNPLSDMESIICKECSTMTIKK